MNEIKELIKKEKENNIESKLGEFESRHTDVSKCFGAVRLLKRKIAKNKLIVYNGNGNIVNTEKQQTDEITTFFREIFGKDNQGTTKEYPPSSIKKPFTEEETSIACKKLRNGKSPGIDKMYAFI